MKVQDIFPSKYARGQDLDGKAVNLVIQTIRAERMRPGPGQPESEKWVIYFTLAKKGVILSRTLAEQIAQAVGTDDIDLWPGKTVTLYPENITVAGVPRTAIRAKAAAVPAGNNGSGE